MINLCVETLIQPGRCQLSAPSMHKVKTGVQNMYMKYTCTSPRISVTKEPHLFICCCVQVEFLSNHNCKVCTRGNVCRERQYSLVSDGSLYFKPIPHRGTAKVLLALSKVRSMN